MKKKFEMNSLFNLYFIDLRDKWENIGREEVGEGYVNKVIGKKILARSSLNLFMVCQSQTGVLL